MIDIHATEARRRDHVKALPVDIGERRVLLPGNLKKTADSIRGFYYGAGLQARLEPYDYQGFEVANVVAEVQLDSSPTRRILIGVHYDSVAGTVGADDNASAVAVQLETARQVAALRGSKGFDLSVMITDSAFYRNPHYRLPSDRAATLDYRFMAELVEGLVPFLVQRTDLFAGLTFAA